MSRNQNWKGNSEIRYGWIPKFFLLFFYRPSTLFSDPRHFTLDPRPSTKTQTHLTQAMEFICRFYHISGLLKQKPTFSAYQTLLKFFCDKTTAIKRWSFSKIVFWTSKQLFSIHLQCLPPDDPRALYANTGIHYWQIIHWSSSLVPLLAQRGT